MKKNITLDFTKGLNGDVALVPASVAKKMMDAYKSTLNFTNPDEIVRAHSEEIRSISYSVTPEKVIEAAILANTDFNETRMFVDGILNNDHYDAKYEGD
jgi:hypothetical protein